MATLPYFFFSYSHGDKDEYLANFFRNLRDRVAFFRGIRESKDDVGFRDYDSIKPGDDWEHKISNALQDSKVLICIYTANFFSLEERQDFAEGSSPLSWIETPTFSTMRTTSSA